MDEIREAAGERDVWVVGGGDLAGQFADAGLLDEIRVSFAPATLPSGKPLLPRTLGADRLELEGCAADRFVRASSTYAVRAPSGSCGAIVVHSPYFGSRPSPDDVPVSRRRTHGPTCSR